MAVFSNLEGTMKKTFILGKNGARFSTDGTEVQVQNYQGTSLVPVSAAEPINPSHLVTLSYFNAHSGGGAGGALSGTTVPSNSLGENGDTYFQLDTDNITQIYFKDQDRWKPFKGTTPGTDSDYVTSVTAMPNEFIAQGTKFEYKLPETIHQRGIDLLVQVQDQGGNTIGTEVTLDGSGNITISVNTQPTDYLIIKLIGATTMTTPYSAFVNKADWSLSTGVYSYTVTAATHGQQAGPLYLAIYQNTVDGSTASAPFDLVTVDTIIDGTGNVTFKSYESFSGKVVISGK